MRRNWSGKLMKRTQIIDAFRNIRSQSASFLSIMIIAMLSANAYLGIAFAAKALNRNVTRYYDAQNVQDLSIYSPLLLTNEDLAAVSALEGIADVEGSYETVAWTENGEHGTLKVSVLSAPERITLPVIQEGRMPETPQEAAVEVMLSQKQGLSVGDRIQLKGQSGGAPFLMDETEFVITGIFYHPDHINLDFMIPPYVIVSKDAFDSDLTEGAWSRARVRLADTPDDRFTEAYWDQVIPAEEQLKELSRERSPKRGSEVWERYFREIEDGERQLAEAETALADARGQLEDGNQLLEDSEQQIQEGWQQIEEAEQQILDADAQIAEGEEKLSEAEAAAAADIGRLETAKAELLKAAEELGIAPDQLDAAEARLRDALFELENGKSQLDEGKAKLDAGKEQVEQIIRYAESFIPEDLTIDDIKAIKEEIHRRYGIDVSVIPNEPEAAVNWIEGEARNWLYEKFGINAGQKEYDANLKKYQNGLQAYEEGRNNYYYMGEQYLDALTAYEKGMKQVAEAELQLKDLYDARGELESKKTELEEARAQLEEKKRELQDAQRSLEEGKAELEENRRLYEEKLAEYESYREQIAEARGLIDKMEDGVWTVLSNHADSGYIFNESNARNLSSMSLTFSMVFIVIAAMVIYSGVGRMVDEQSRLVGATKAMGLYNREIFAKYLTFGLAATGIGLLLGIVVACFVMQRILLRIYNYYYHVNVSRLAFLPTQTVILIIGGLLVAALAVRFSTSRLLRSTAITLMNGTGPVSSHLRGKSGGSLYSRLIRLNMLSDMKRVVVTIVSVAGCCTLLMAGFGLKYAVARIPDRQYGGVISFDVELTYDAENPATEAELLEYLDQAGMDGISVYQNSHLILMGETISDCSLICVDADQIEGFYNLRDLNGKGPMTLPEHGVLIPRRMAESFDLEKGDTLTLFDSKMHGHEVTVAGVFNNHFLHLVFASPAAYEEIFGSSAEQNCMFIKLNGKGFSELNDGVRNIDGVLTVASAEDGRMQLEKGSGAMNGVVALMIVCAALMAYFIQVNLAESYMIHKKKELVVMRINGFSVRECVHYAALEMIVTSVLGIVIGIPVGAGFGYIIIRSCEAEYMQLVRSVDWRSVLFSILITALFSLLINAAALRRIRTLKLSDA